MAHDARRQKQRQQSASRQWNEIRFQWENNFTISLANEKDLHNLFVRASFDRIRLRPSLIFVEQRVLSFTGWNELYFSCVCSQWQRADRARSPLSPLDANKSRNSDAPSTRGFHVCRWNLISAAFVTKHAVVLFSLFFTPPSAPLFILCARSSTRSRYRSRDTIFASNIQQSKQSRTSRNNKFN